MKYQSRKSIMNYEFIIGTVIGVVGLIVSYIRGKEQIKSFFRPNLQDLLNQLTDSNKSLANKKA